MILETRRVASYFDDIWQKGKPICKLLKAEKETYIYDTGTNKIFKCNDHEGNLLEMLLNMDIYKAIDKYLSKYNEKTFLCASDFNVGIIYTYRHYVLIPFLPDSPSPCTPVTKSKS